MPGSVRRLLSSPSYCVRGRDSRAIQFARRALIASLVFATAFVFVEYCSATKASAGPPSQSSIQDEGTVVRRIVVTRNKSRTFRVDAAFDSAVVGAPDIADVLPMSDRIIYVQGKKSGTTNISLFDRSKHVVAIIDVQVTIDTNIIADKIRTGTNSPGIRVSADNDQIVLSGEARNAADADKAMTIAKGMVTPPEGKEPDRYVVNAMRIAASQQVLLRVRFIEISRQAERDLGVKWFAGDGGSRGVNVGTGSVTQAGRTIQGTGTSTAGGLPVLSTVSTFAGSTLSQPFGVGLLNLANKGISVDVLLTALESKGLARRLAEPDLVALSGDTASFLAGGEYPVPTVQPSAGATPLITTEYHPFGVQLSFVPTVLASGVINLRLTPSVSELDYTNAVSISGTTVPSLTKREARTTIEMRDGQSFAIAGLLQSDNLRDVSQLPWIGSVPVLGALFRSTAYHQNETELVVIVTPHLAAPAVPGQALATPFDKQLPGNDVDLFLMGRPEVRKRYNDYVTSGGEVQGPYGYIMPLPPK